MRLESFRIVSDPDTFVEWETSIGSGDERVKLGLPGPSRPADIILVGIGGAYYEFSMKDFVRYASSALLEGIPCLEVSDLPKALDYYSGSLGFVCAEARNSCAVPRRDGLCVMLRQAENPVPSQTCGAYFRVRDIASLYEEFRSNGAVVEAEPTADKRTGAREFGIRDPDRNILRFGQYAEGTGLFPQLPLPHGFDPDFHGPAARRDIERITGERHNGTGGDRRDNP
jgi:catechol 2,3-dioxygenase-like lactoylglutathione lyase family enzyme